MTHGTRGRRTRGALRLGAVLLATLTVGASVAACRDVVAGDAVDVATVLCDTFTACGIAEGCDRVDAYFEGFGDEASDQLLAIFEEQGCDQGCSAVAACLDFDPMCLPPEGGSTCEDDALCCGGTSGEGRCEAGSCCRSLATVCEDDAECCPLDGQPVACAEATAVIDDGSALVKTCGGLPPCGTLGSGCELDGDCCSGTCDNNSCARITCVASGEKCLGGDTCCESPKESCSDRGICEPADPCENPKDDPIRCCADDGGGCAANPGDPGLPCCGSDDVAECFGQPDGRGVCSLAGCAPPGSFCNNDVDCCEPVGDRNVACLKIPGTDGRRVCQDLTCEPDLFAPCGTGCCAGLVCDTESVTCVEACEPGDCHDPRQVGPGIDYDSCTANDPVQASRAKCAEDVCLSDPSCCCHRWDTFCIDIALLSEACNGVFNPDGG